MKHTLLVVGLLTASLVANAECSAPNLTVQSMTDGGYRFSPPLSRDEVERTNMEASTYSPRPKEVPQIAFGKLNPYWLELTKKMKPGDTFHKITSKSSEGYVLVRGECVIGSMTTWIIG